MTVSVTLRRSGPYITNSVLTVFAFDFKVFAAADVRVVYAASGVTGADLLLTTDYTVVLNGNQDTNPGGTVTTVGAFSPRAPGTITILSRQAYQQPTDITGASGAFPQTIEDALDYQNILIQQLRELIGRQITVPASDVSVTELPPFATRANRYFAFGAAGEPIAVAGPATSGGIPYIPPSPYGATLIAAADAPSARVVLGGTTVGSALFTAAAVGDARTAIGATAVGASLIIAVDAAAARAAIGAAQAGSFAASGANTDITSLAAAVTSTTQALGTNNTTLATTAYVQANMLASPAQSWQVVSRTLGTTYTNSTGRPIMCSVAITTALSSVSEFEVAGVFLGRVNLGIAGAAGTFFFVVPAGATYRCFNSTGSNTLFNWSELR